MRKTEVIPSLQEVWLEERYGLQAHVCSKDMYYWLSKEINKTAALCSDFGLCFMIISQWKLLASVC